jgi:hypothetical protein
MVEGEIQNRVLLMSAAGDASTDLTVLTDCGQGGRGGRQYEHPGTTAMSA